MTQDEKNWLAADYALGSCVVLRKWLLKLN